MSCLARPWLDTILGTASAILAPPLASPAQAELARTDSMYLSDRGQKHSQTGAPPSGAGPSAGSYAVPDIRLPGMPPPGKTAREKLHSVMGIVAAVSAFRGSATRSRRPSEMLFSEVRESTQSGRASNAGRVSNRATQLGGKGSKSFRAKRRESALPFGVSDVLRGDFG